MSSPNIELHIEELALHGFARGQRYEIAEAIGRELERLFADSGVGQSFADPTTVDRLDAGGFEIKQPARPDALGAGT